MDVRGGTSNIIDVSYDNLKTIALSETPNSWNNIYATKTNSKDTESILINKIILDDSQINPANTNIDSANKNIKVDFIKENNNEKVYCKNSVRHHKEKNRNYIDESSFDGQEFVDKIILEYLNDVYVFFDKDNSSLLISSQKNIDGITTKYFFEALLDKGDNTILKATFTLKNNTLEKIEVQITSTTKTKETSIVLKETTEVVNTPEWFDNNDFKTSMTYEEVKQIVNETNFDDWDSAELFLPVGYDAYKAEDEYWYTSRSQNKTYIIADTYKKYFDGSSLYTYTDKQTSQETLEPDNAYEFANILNTYKTFTFSYFFANETMFQDYYEAGKKYEKDLTVISYKYSGNGEGTKFESICSLYFDTEGNLYQILCYAKQFDTSNLDDIKLTFNINLSLKKTAEFNLPDWCVSSSDAE